MDLLLMEANRIGTKIIREMWNDLAEHEEKMAEIKKEAQRIEQEAQRIEEERIEIEERGKRNKESEILENEYESCKQELAEACNNHKNKKHYLDIMKKRNKITSRKYKQVINLQHKIRHEIQQTLCKINTATIKSANRTIEQLDANPMFTMNFSSELNAAQTINRSFKD